MNDISLNIYSTDSSKHIQIKNSTVVTMKTSIKLIGTETSLEVNISADFKDIPPKYHENYLHAMRYQYDAPINIYDCTDNWQPKAIKKEKKDWTFKQFILNLISKNKL